MVMSAADAASKRFGAAKTLMPGGFTPPAQIKLSGVPQNAVLWGAMPGLPKVPAAEKVDVDENGRISGLF